MGQRVGVKEKPAINPGVVRYELNRSLTGMGHERFTSVLDAGDVTPASRLAKELLSTGQVAAVHVYQNMVTVDLAKGFTSEGLSDIIADMYQYWRPGVEPPTFDDVADEADGAPAEVAAGTDPAMAEAAKRVPMHLLERAAAARERWKAKHG